MPTVGLQVITSEVDRHLIVLGADPISGTSRTGTIDPMLIAFSDQENELEFEPLSTNTAGSLRLSSGSSIIGAVKSRQEILVWTDTALYSMQFIGPPFTFAINLINEGRLLEAADEFLDHEGYRRAKRDSNYTGIAPRMEALSQALRDYGNSLTE